MSDVPSPFPRSWQLRLHPHPARCQTQRYTGAGYPTGIPARSLLPAKASRPGTVPHKVQTSIAFSCFSCSSSHPFLKLRPIHTSEMYPLTQSIILARSKERQYRNEDISQISSYHDSADHHEQNCIHQDDGSHCLNRKAKACISVSSLFVR